MIVVAQFQINNVGRGTSNSPPTMNAPCYTLVWFTPARTVFGVNGKYMSGSSSYDPVVLMLTTDK